MYFHSLCTDNYGLEINFYCENIIILLLKKLLISFIKNNNISGCHFFILKKTQKFNF